MLCFFWSQSQKTGNSSSSSSSSSNNNNNNSNNNSSSCRSRNFVLGQSRCAGSNGRCRGIGSSGSGGGGSIKSSNKNREDAVMQPCRWPRTSAAHEEKMQPTLQNRRLKNTQPRHPDMANGAYFAMGWRMLAASFFCNRAEHVAEHLILEFGATLHGKHFRIRCVVYKPRTSATEKQKKKKTVQCWSSSRILLLDYPEVKAIQARNRHRCAAPLSQRLRHLARKPQTAGGNRKCKRSPEHAAGIVLTQGFHSLTNNFSLASDWRTECASTARCLPCTDSYSRMAAATATTAAVEFLDQILCAGCIFVLDTTI